MLNFWHRDEVMSENFSDPGTTCSSGRYGNYCCSFEILPEIARVVCEKMMSLVSACTAQAVQLIWMIREQFIEDIAQSSELREALVL